MSLPLARSVQQVHYRAEDDFLRTVEINHGPAGLLGRYFLKTYAYAKAQGITLTFASMGELMQTNKSNAESWPPLVTVFDDRFFHATPENVFCIVGRDQDGRIVATHAARLYDWPDSSFHDEASSLRLFYDDPKGMRRPAETCKVTAASAKQVKGPTVYSGAAWYHPDFRGRGLSTILPLLGKTYALTRWPATTIISLMTEAVQARGFATRFGYTTVDWDVCWTNSPLGTLRLAFLSVRREETFKQVENSLASGAQVDASVLRRRA